MNHYAQTLLLAAHPETVFAALSTQKGIRGWWTEDCDVDDRAGGAIHLRFGRNRKDMLIAGARIRSRSTLALHGRVHRSRGLLAS